MSFILTGIQPKSITHEKIVEFIEDSGTKRINFATSHSHALRKKDGEVGGKVILPFKETIEPILKKKLDMDLFPSKYGGFWRVLNSNEEYSSFENFIQEYNSVVFLRDNLDISLALSMNYIDDERTPIGELEYQAKFNNNKESERKLIEVCNEWIEKCPFLKEVNYICAMPSSNTNEGSLPRRIVANLNGFNFDDISNYVCWTTKTRSIKEAESPEQKLEILEESGLQISKELDLKGKKVLLFDDLYMSGVSMQYIAMKLKEAGASIVYGLCVVKSRSNTAR